jgi:hypothetical protein
MRDEPHAPIVIRSPRESAIPCVLLRIRTCPMIVPASVRSTLKLASASSPTFPRRQTSAPDRSSKLLTEQATSIHVCGEEIAFAGYCTLGCEAGHVRRLHDMFQVVAGVTAATDVRNSVGTWQHISNTYDMVVETFTRFSHSNSVHMLRN